MYGVFVNVLLLVMSVVLDNTCTISGKGNVSRVIPTLYGWVYKTIRLSPLMVEHSVVVMSERLNPMGSQSSIPACVQNQWRYKIMRPSSRLLNWRFEFNYR